MWIIDEICRETMKEMMDAEEPILDDDIESPLKPRELIAEINLEHNFIPDFNQTLKEYKMKKR